MCLLELAIGAGARPLVFVLRQAAAGAVSCAAAAARRAAAGGGQGMSSGGGQPLHQAAHLLTTITVEILGRHLPRKMIVLRTGFRIRFRFFTDLDPAF